MSLSPEQIATRRFVVALRGYDKDEVDGFLVEVGDQVAELMRQASDAGAPADTRDDSFTRYSQMIESVLRSAAAAAEEIRDQAAQEVADLRAAAMEEVQQRRDEAERAIAEQRQQLEREREEFVSSAVLARQQAEHQIEELKAAASETLRAAQASEAAANETRESARRELASAQASRVAAEEEASALLARAASEAERYRQEIINQLQKSLRELATLTNNHPPIEFGNAWSAEPVTTSSQSEAAGDER